MALVLGTNSYITQADADTYFADNLRNDLWTPLSTTVKDQALITASQQISLAVIDECKLPLTPPIDDNLAFAAAELGLDMAIDPAVITQVSTSGNISKLKAGSAQIEYFRGTTGTRFPATSHAYLVAAGCLDSGISSGTGNYASGTGSESHFDDPCEDQFLLNKGLA